MHHRICEKSTDLFEGTSIMNSENLVRGEDGVAHIEDHVLRFDRHSNSILRFDSPSGSDSVTAAAE